MSEQKSRITEIKERLHEIRAEYDLLNKELIRRDEQEQLKQLNNAKKSKEQRIALNRLMKNWSDGFGFCEAFNLHGDGKKTYWICDKDNLLKQLRGTDIDIYHELIRPHLSLDEIIKRKEMWA